MIISIAWINYFNLTNSTLFDFAKEISIRKVNGASKANVIKQFIIEVFLINLISVIISLGILILCLPYLEFFLDKPLGWFLMHNLWIFLLLPVLLLVGVTISGVYPSFVLASIKPCNALKGNVLSKSGKLIFEKSLVVCQLSASVILIISVLVINKQLHFIQSKDLGHRKDQIVMIDAPCTMNMDSTKHTKFKMFKYSLLGNSNSNINSVTSAGTGIGSQLLNDVRYRSFDDKEKIVSLKTNVIDEDFIHVFGIKWLAGDSINQKEYRNNNLVLINESASKILGFKTPFEAIGNELKRDDNRVLIGGVISDFHQQSLRSNIQPTLFYYLHPSIFGTYSVRFNSSDIHKTIDYLKEEWVKVYPNDPFVYRFLDDHINSLYLKDKRFSQTLLLFTILSILVACLGLLGLIIITTRKRTKEIGVRKVNGAKNLELVSMLLKDYLIWIILAVFIASPLAYFAMDKWLQNFAYKTELSWWIFALAGIIALGITLLTVSWQSWRAARRNPVESLRYE